ncbi:MAG: ABC transporter substrate-binding protein [Gemmatimonadales bacterium]|nr:ABC transporter substrate-binding protein [Gemmatimonadales bacterium]NIN12820.1 ABC transporter substrate-binding protein [Gemmatimonadales bacterium]NIN48748.1 ABC transporter substrate-binding protein [Gemmatimonadales bacterium]NIP06212.1 ABC transporter substrate-binding protein [Gemmatimonadales bacterium]NIR01397.1 ABC transporter substrate-binding protein [Gemmatimonadales bacterium]
MIWRRSPLVLGAALLTACGPSGSPSSGPVVDDAGRPVALDRPAQRIVSLSPATTELLFAIGAGDRVVGRTRWCEDPPEATRVPSVGDGLNPNVEVVAARRPDLVVFYHSPLNAAAIEQLAGMRVATASLELDGLADLRRAAGMLGELTGQRARADSLVAAFDAELAELTGSPVAERPSVLILSWASPPIVIGSGSFLSEIVELAGGRNLFGDLPQPSATVSIETVAARDPDVVLVVEGGERPAWAERPEWQIVGAVREGSFAVVTGTEFGRPSFRAPRAIRQLRSVMRQWAH